MMKAICRLCMVMVLSFILSVCDAAKPAYIMDTDMGFDDWLAVLYVLVDRAIDLKAVTIDCVGETYCPAGAVNAAKLATLSRHLVPVFIGAASAPLSYAFPKPIRQYASNMAVPGFGRLLAADVIHSVSAAQGIAKIVVNAALAHKKVSIISIGTATNIADAYVYARAHHQANLFRQGLGEIYKGGGAFGQVVNSTLTNQNIPGNIAIPGLYKSHNTSAEWNIYANAPAMQVLLSAKLPIIFIPNNATDQVPMNWRIYHTFLHRGQRNHLDLFTARAMTTLYALQHQWYGLDFWDTAVTLAALYPHIVTKKFHVPVRVSLKNNLRYGAILVANHGQMVDVDYQINKAVFYRRLFSGLDE